MPEKRETDLDTAHLESSGRGGQLARKERERDGNSLFEIRCVDV